MVQVEGTGGRIVGVWSWSENDAAEVMAERVELSTDAFPVAIVTTRDGTVAAHEPAAHGWHVGLTARHSRSSIDLEGLRPAAVSEPADYAPEITRPGRSVVVPLIVALRDVQQEGVLLRLSEHHYVPTEEPWGGNNQPTALVRLGATATELVIHVECTTGHPVVLPEIDDGGTPYNPLDNERADINADGLQCYIGRVGEALGRWRQGVLGVPLPAGEARMTVLAPNGSLPQATSACRTDGWSLTLSWPRSALPEGSLSFDLVVNERPVSRERRRGQLVLSGGGGFGYLRGDRHAPHTPVEILLP